MLTACRPAGLCRSIGLADELTAAGVRVQLNAPVAKVSHRPSASGAASVTIHLHGSDAQIRAARVIVAMPPASASRIHFEPRLPYLREQLMSRQFIGCIIKGIVLYKTPFWVGRRGRAVLTPRVRVHS